MVAKKIRGEMMQQFKSELKMNDRLLSSIYKISSLLTRSTSLDKILTTIVEEASRVFGYTRVGIFLINKDLHLLECKYAIGFRKHEADRAFRFPFDLEKDDCVETLVAKKGKTVYIKDYQKDPRISRLDLKVSALQSRVSTVAVPLKIKKDVIGLLEADKNDEKLNLTQKDIRLFSIFANQASIVIENTRLQEQNKRKIEQLLALQNISKKTSSTLDLKKLFNVIITNALKITRASTCSLFLVDSKRGYLKIASQKGYKGIDIDKFRLEIGEGICGWVAKMGVPLLVREVDKEPRYLEIIGGIKSELAVPLVHEKHVVGVLNLNSYRPAAFAQEDVELLMIFASHTATLIENARLYEEVLTERNFAENILESAPNGVITVDRIGKISSINRRIEEIFEMKREDVVHKNVHEKFVDKITDIVDLALKNYTTVDNREVRINRGGGQQIALGVSSSLLKKSNKEVIGVLLIIRDLTEVKKTEEFIRRVDRLTSLGQLSAGIAHEIRNPLASINFNVQMLSKKMDMDDKIKEIIDDTLAGITRIKRLVRGIHDFAKPGTPSLRQSNITDLIMDSISLLDSQLKKRKIGVNLDIDENVQDMTLDPLKIQQVFINLLINAMDAMPRGGVLTVRTWKENTRSDAVENLAVYISDNGEGIPPENLSKIFDPFFTTKAEGTGLGLSITHKILEQHNAIIETESQVGKGTAFIIRFPIYMSANADVSIQSINS
ncbi:MAG: GAF domain-containing protein [Deltaproteobacteria bacterium]|nr:GAF domain-containing protein [Deltaproteobacteria bacterium]